MPAQEFSGSGDPNGVVFGSPGDTYQDQSGSGTPLWTKVSGFGTNTGWVAGAGATATQYAFVYQPGGTPHDNVYDDWPALITAMNAIDGPKLLQFDDSFETIAIPPGTWDVNDVTWIGPERQVSFFSNITTVAFDDGAVVTGLRRIRNLRLVATTVTVAPINDFADGDVFYIEASVIAAGNPVFDFSGLGFIKSATLVLTDESQILQGDGAAGAPIKMGAVSSALRIYVEKWSLLEANTINDDGGGAGDLLIFQDGQNNNAVVQSFFTGNILKFADLDSFNITSNQSPLALDTGSLNDYPFGNDTTINLPPAAWHPGGWLVVKNNYAGAIAGGQSPTNALVVVPSGGDSIDARASYVLAAGAGAVILASDGVTTWQVIGTFEGQTTSATSASGSTPGAAPGESVELGGPVVPRFELTDNQAYTIVVQGVARGLVADLPNVQSFRQTFAVRKDAGVTAIAAAGVLEQLGDGASASWSLAASVGAAPDRFRLIFNTGTTTAAVHVTATCEITEVA